MKGITVTTPFAFYWDWLNPIFSSFEESFTLKLYVVVSIKTGNNTFFELILASFNLLSK